MNEQSQETKRFAEGLFQQMQLISDYCQKIHDDMVSGILEKTPREITMHGIFLRAVCLMKTLRKCNEASDFQSIIQANRALIEIAVDLVLLLHDTTGDIDKKIRFWEQSAKLKAAQKVVGFYKSQGKSVPIENKDNEDFISREQIKIEAERVLYWGNNRHPNRWTARDLSVGVKDADALEDVDLQKIYQLEYSRMNWFAHGSGLTGSRDFNADGFVSLCGLAYASCGWLALICAKILLKAFGYFKFPDIYSETWKERNEAIKVHIVPFLPV